MYNCSLTKDERQFIPSTGFM